MALKTTVEVRQPVPNDLVGSTFAVAGIGAGFEGTVGLRVLDASGTEVAQGSGQSSGGMMGVGEFVGELSLGPGPSNGLALTLQAFGDDPSGEHQPGTDLYEVPVIFFRDLQGWLLYEVERGDNLTKIARNLSEFGHQIRVDDIVAANPEQISDPNHIEPGWLLRVPLR
jgi:nucleoid-associated protein YgaU